MPIREKLTLVMFKLSKISQHESPRSAIKCNLRQASTDHQFKFPSVFFSRSSLIGQFVAVFTQWRPQITSKWLQLQSVQTFLFIDSDVELLPWRTQFMTEAAGCLDQQLGKYRNAEQLICMQRESPMSCKNPPIIFRPYHWSKLVTWLI